MRAKRIHGGVLVQVGIALLMSALIGLLGYRQYVKAATAEILVADSRLPAGKTIASGDLSYKRVEGSPQGVIDDPGVLLGKRLSAPKEAGEPFYTSDLKVSDPFTMAQRVPEGRVLYTLVPDRHLLPYSKSLQAGDRFDILLTHKAKVYPLAFDVILVGAMRPKNPGQGSDNSRSQLMALASPQKPDASDSESGLLLLAVHPSHVYPLAQTQGAPGKLSFVVHGKSELKKGKRLSIIPAPRTRNIEIYSGLSKSEVQVSL